MLRVKVCGMRYPDNVKEVATSNPDYLGFIFYPESQRYAGSKPEKSVFDNIPEGTRKVGVFVNEDHDKMLEISEEYGLGILQLHGDESPELCMNLRSSGLMIIKAFNIDTNFRFGSLVRFIPVCDYFLFDTGSKCRGGSGIKFNWSRLEEYNLGVPFFLSGGIGPEDIEIILQIKNDHMHAVDINSRFEISPGVKDPVLVDTFINKIKNSRV